MLFLKCQCHGPTERLGSECGAFLVSQATVAVVTAPVTITEVMTRTRGDVWCVVTFADNTHTTDRVPDVTSGTHQDAYCKRARA